MKKIIFLIFMLLLTACGNKITPKTPNEILLSIKNYSCKMKISYFSNKNETEYLATQSYSSTGKYSMEFLDTENLKLNYENSKLNISTTLFENNLELENYKDLNQNPLFLSYFINTYFNEEQTTNTTITENSIDINLPNHSSNLTSAKLIFENGKPHILTYFDANGNKKVNIIYSEFTFI